MNTEKNKIRLLRIAYNDLGHGGIQSQFMGVTQKLKDEIVSDVVVWRNAPAYYDEEFSKYGKIFRCERNRGSGRLQRAISFLTEYHYVKNTIRQIICENGPYDVVHCHMALLSAPCMVAAKREGVKIRIAQAHNMEPVVVRKGFNYYINRVRKRINGLILKRSATHLVACSQMVADAVYGKNNGFAMYNGIELSHFDFNLYPGSSSDEIQIIHVGRFGIQKNQLYIVDILDRLRSLGCKCKLTLIGEGEEYMNQVKEKVEKLKLEEMVSFLPHDSNIAFEMSKSDVFLFPSTYEGFGNVLIEAQAMGLKCFVSTEVTSEADCGLLTYLPLNAGAEKWAETIYTYAKKNGKRKHQIDVSKFSREKCAERWLKLYSGE